MEKDTLEILLNGELVLEFDRVVKLPDYQESYLVEMDDGMDKGIPVGEDIIESPSKIERSQFVTHTLIDALLRKSTDEAQAMCAYLATRSTDLAQIIFETSDADNSVSVKLIYKQNLS